jgi:hypothetical protein
VEYEWGRGVHKVLLGKPEVKNHMEYLDVNGRIILKRIFKICDGDMDWVNVAQDMERRRDIVNAVMNR